MLVHSGDRSNSSWVANPVLQTPCVAEEPADDFSVNGHKMLVAGSQGFFQGVVLGVIQGNVPGDDIGVVSD